MKFLLSTAAPLIFMALSTVVVAAPAPFSVTSPDLDPAHPIPERHILNDYGCKGGNRSPALEWHGVPEGTKSFAITMFDMDERGSPSGWWHWVVYDIPASASRLAQNGGALNSRELPSGAIQGRTDLSQDAYHGPCPGKGEPPHRYRITVYALSVAKLPVPPEASGAMVSWTAHDYTLGTATLIARYGR
jgi:Raf kinase inhibitor-like YbhB/YbcL family protein